MDPLELLTDADLTALAAAIRSGRLTAPCRMSDMARKKGRKCEESREKPSGAQPLKPLRGRQKRFVEEYIVDLNAAAAYRRAGYKNSEASRHSASDLLAQPHIQAAIAEEQQRRATRTELTQDYVITSLRTQAELYSDRDSHSARVAALKLLGLHLGMFGDNEYKKELEKLRQEQQELREEIDHDRTSREEQGTPTTPSGAGGAAAPPPSSEVPQRPAPLLSPNAAACRSAQVT
jgi:hypothetical protein